MKLQPRGVTRTINKSSTPALANPEPSDERAEAQEVPGGESGVPAVVEDFFGILPIDYVGAESLFDPLPEGRKR